MTSIKTALRIARKTGSDAVIEPFTFVARETDGVIQLQVVWTDPNPDPTVCWTFSDSICLTVNGRTGAEFAIACEEAWEALVRSMRQHTRKRKRRYALRVM